MALPGFGAISTGGYNQQPTKIRAGPPGSGLDVALGNVLGNGFYNQEKNTFAMDFRDVSIPSMFQQQPAGVNLFNDASLISNQQPTQLPVFQHATIEDDIDDNYHYGKEYMMLLKELSDKSQEKLAIGDAIFSSKTQEKHWYKRNSNKFCVAVGIWKLNDMLLTAQTSGVTNPRSKLYANYPPERQSAREKGMYPQTIDEFLKTYRLAGVLSDERDSTIQDSYSGNTSRNVMVHTDGQVLMPNLWGAKVQGGRAELWVVLLDARKLNPTHHNWKGELVGPTPANKVLQVLPYLSTNYADDSNEINLYLKNVATASLRETGDTPIRYPLGIIEEVKGPVPSQEMILKALQNNSSYKALLARSYVRVRLNLSRLSVVT